MKATVLNMGTLNTKRHCS